MNTRRHPCFDAEARHHFGRVHLPVAPRCNLGCNFCNRRFDCLNESRPGVTSTVLSPHQAVGYLVRVMDLVDVPISVVGIAGPGDPFANPDETMTSLRLARQQFADILLCVASNGLAIGPHLDELADLRVSHVTITVNAVDPEIGSQIYRFVRPGRRVYRGHEGAALLLRRQLEAIEGLTARGITVKVNSIVIPGVNDDHIETIAATVARMGVAYQNCMALYSLDDTPFGNLVEPDAARMASVRRACERHLPQMTHCQRCRADAAGMLGEDNEQLIREAMAAAAMPLRPEDDRPHVAVASLEGMLVNQHLGQAEQLWILRPAEGEGYELVETRPTPLPGDGADRWQVLSRRLADCRALLCSAAGQKPKLALAREGVQVLVTEGLAEEALDALYAGVTPRVPAASLVPAGTEHGGGCGGCTGSGTGCG
jgi:nitrogen fixation protein NifB